MPTTLPSAIASGPTVPSDTPFWSNASNVVVPSPSVQTIPAIVGNPNGPEGSNMNVMPPNPSGLKYECPLVPEPSIVPSSASTESVRPPGPVTEPFPVTPGTSSAPLSNVSRQKFGAPSKNGLSAELRYGVGPRNVAAPPAYAGPRKP